MGANADSDVGSTYPGGEVAPKGNSVAPVRSNPHGQNQLITVEPSCGIVIVWVIPWEVDDNEYDFLKRRSDYYWHNIRRFTSRNA